jgi:hypothetical protein
MFIAGVVALGCPSTEPAANNDAATKAVFKIALFITLLSSKKIRKPGTLVAARTGAAPRDKD